VIIIAKKKKNINKQKLKPIIRKDFKLSALERKKNAFRGRGDPKFRYDGEIYLKKERKWVYDGRLSIIADNKKEFLSVSKNFIRLPKYRKLRKK